MRYAKKIAVPFAQRQRVRLPAEKWKNYGLTLNHLRPRNGALVLAEGASKAYSTDNGSEYLIATQSQLVTLYPYFKRIRLLMQNRQWLLPDIMEAEDYVLPSGVRILYILTKNSLNYDENASLSGYLKKPGGYSMAVHKDRIFFAGTDGKLYWSFAYPDRGFRSTGTQESGTVDLIDQSLGAVVRVFSLGENLLLFHERGLQRLEGTADPLTFRLVRTGVEYKTIHGKSVARCGVKAWFFTDDGLYATDGFTAERVKNAAEGEIDLTASVHGSSYGGEYYAALTRRDGLRQAYCYDRVYESGRFIGLESISLACLHGVYRLKGSSVDLLEGSALPEVGKVSAKFCYDLTDIADGAGIIEALEVEGEGMYEAEVTANGITRRAKGEAGKRLALNGVLRANRVTVEIKPCGTAFALRGVVLCKRREDVYGD